MSSSDAVFTFAIVSRDIPSARCLQFVRGATFVTSFLVQITEGRSDAYVRSWSSDTKNINILRVLYMYIIYVCVCALSCNEKWSWRTGRQSVPRVNISEQTTDRRLMSFVRRCGWASYGALWWSLGTGGSFSPLRFSHNHDLYSWLLIRSGDPVYISGRTETPLKTKRQREHIQRKSLLKRARPPQSGRHVERDRVRGHEYTKKYISIYIYPRPWAHMLKSLHVPFYWFILQKNKTVKTVAKFVMIKLVIKTFRMCNFFDRSNETVCNCEFQLLDDVAFFFIIIVKSCFLGRLSKVSRLIVHSRCHDSIRKPN